MIQNTTSRLGSSLRQYMILIIFLQEVELDIEEHVAILTVAIFR